LFKIIIIGPEGIGLIRTGNSPADPDQAAEALGIIWRADTGISGT